MTDEQKLPYILDQVTLQRAVVRRVAGTHGPDERHRLEADFEIRFGVAEDSFGPVSLTFEPNNFYMDRQGGTWLEPSVTMVHRGQDVPLPYEGRLPSAAVLHVEAERFLSPARAADFRRQNGAPIRFRLLVKYERGGKGWDSPVYTAKHEGLS